MSDKQVQDDLIDIQGGVLKIFEKNGYHYNCESHADIMRLLESKKSNFENITPEILLCSPLTVLPKILK